MPTTIDPRFPDATTTGTVPFRGCETWYRVTGTLDSKAEAAPLVVLHGGPGCAHNYCLMMANLASQGRAVIHYDQLGCGDSTHLPHADPSFWTADVFIEEVRAVVDYLGIGDRFHLLGQSWGGMLAPEFVLADGAGVQSLTICDSPASMQLWLQAAGELRNELPTWVQESLVRHEDAGTTDDPEYVEAMQEFYDRYVCRVVPNPQEVTDTFSQLEDDPTVYHTMNGPSEFHVIGSLRNWSIIDRLPGIAVPSLVIAGEHDEAQPATWAPFVEHIPGVRSHVFSGASHMPHVESPQEFITVVGDFLRQHD